MSASPIILPYQGVMPTIHPSAFVAPGAVIIGDVTIEAEANIWFGCVLRGDVQSIHVGERTNIQDGSVVHVTRKTGPTKIGAGITIGHKVLLHACTLEDDCFVGMGAVVMDGAVVQKGAMVAAGALVAPGKVVPTGQLWAGNPARYFRDLKLSEADFIPVSAANYVALAAAYR